MAEMKSSGLMGLSHYRQSRVSVDLFEPVYQNLFTVQITLPASIGATPQDTNLLLEGVKNVGGLDTSKNPGAVQQQYKFADRSFAGAKPSNTYIDITLDFEVNLQYTGSGDLPGMYIVKTLRKWSDLMYDPLTGRMGLKRDYVAPNMTITQQDRAGNPFRGWILYNVFPTTNITAPTLEYTSDSLYTVNGYTLRCDFWDEVIL